MKKILLFFLFALGAMQGRAQLLVDADYNATADEIAVTFRNMSDSLTLIFIGERFANPDAEMKYVELEDGRTIAPSHIAGFFPDEFFFLHPGEQRVCGYPLPKGSNVRAFCLKASYWRANMPKEEWGKDKAYKMKNHRKYLLPGKSRVDFLRTIK